MSKHDPNKRQRLKKFDFSGEGSAMHLVADFQGGPANGETVIMTKASNTLTFEQIAKTADVKVELSMEEFLRKFFDLWGDDAAKLASLLGYEIEKEDERYEWKPFDERIEEFNEKVTLLKSVWAKNELPESDMLEVLNLQARIEKSLVQNNRDVSVEADVKTPANQGIIKNKETQMTDKNKETEVVVGKAPETISKAQFAEQGELLKKAMAAIAVQTEKAEKVEKALEDEKAARVEDKNKVLQAELKKSVASISVLQDETKAEVEAFLFKARNIEGAEVVLKALKDVQDQVKKALTSEEGVDTHIEADVAEDETDALMKAVLALNTEDSK